MAITLEDFVWRLEGVRDNGAGQYSAKCPAHADRAASLSFAQGANGGIVYTCHAGCDKPAIAAAVGCTLADFMPPREHANGRACGPTKHHHANGAARDCGTTATLCKPAQERKPREFTTHEGATNFLSRIMEKEGKKLARVWKYQNEHGEAVGLVLRYQGEPAADGEKPSKTIRPVALLDGKWRLGGMPSPRPLYKLPELLASPTRPVLIVEGERSADAATQIGLLAATSAHGAKSAHETNWSPLAGRRVVLMPDHDEAGESYVATVAGLLSRLATPPAEIRVLRLADHEPWLPKGGDIADYVEHGEGLPPEELKKLVGTMVERAPVYRPPAVERGEPSTTRERHPPRAPAPSASAAAVTKAPAWLEIGGRAIAKDRGNVGEVTLIGERTASLLFTNPETGAQWEGSFGFDQVAPPGNGEAGAEPLKLEIISSAEFHERAYKTEYLVEDILADGQLCLMSGKSKSLKTSIALDLAISLGSCTPFLGRFVAAQCSVLVLSGESGPAALQDTARRICRARDIALEDCRVNWGFQLPQLANAGHLAALEKAITESKARVVMIDPLYLCLLGAGQGSAASNLFEVGPILSGVARLGERTGATMVLLHHNKKGVVGFDRFGPPEFEELAFSGFAEFARQWLLINRRSAYVDGTGAHELWLRVGGSAGHSSLWGLNVEEGKQSDDGGRKWGVAVENSNRIHADQKAKRETKKAKKAEETALRKMVEVRRVLKETPEGLTQREITTATGINNDGVRAALLMLQKDGTIENCELPNRGRKTFGIRWKEPHGGRA